jgi:hypothetical protein
MAEWDDFDRPPGERSAAALKRLVRYQRWLLAVVLAQLALWGGNVALVALGNGGPGLRFPLALTFLLGCVGGVFVFLLAWELRGPVAAVVFGAATVIPCVGLVVLTLVNGYATTELKKHGLKVGLFGASAAAVDERADPYDHDADAGW